MASTEGGAHSSVRVDGAVTSKAVVPLALVVGAAVVGGVGHVAHNLAGVCGGVPHAPVILVTGLLEGVAVGALGEAVTAAGCADGGLEALSGGYILGAGHVAQRFDGVPHASGLEVAVNGVVVHVHATHLAQLRFRGVLTLAVTLASNLAIVVQFALHAACAGFVVPLAALVGVSDTFIVGATEATGAVAV